MWVRSEKAFYKINSVDPLYESQWASFHRAASIAGHVINSLLNSPSSATNYAILKYICRLCQESMGAVVSAITENRIFILGQILNQQKKRLMHFDMVKSMRCQLMWEEFIEATSKCQISLSSALVPDFQSIEDLKQSSVFRLPVPRANLPISILPVMENNAIKMLVVNSPQSEHLIHNTQPFQSAKRRAIHSILPLPLLKIRLPLIEDLEFECPFCNLILYREKKINVACKLLTHIQRFHRFSDTPATGAQNMLDTPHMKIPEIFEHNSAQPDALLWPTKGIIEEFKEGDLLYLTSEKELMTSLPSFEERLYIMVRSAVSKDRKFICQQAKHKENWIEKDQRPDCTSWYRFPIDLESSASASNHRYGATSSLSNRLLARVLEISGEFCYNCNAMLAYGVKNCHSCGVFQDPTSRAHKTTI